MNIKNLYIAYIFQKDAYEWKNKKEMIFDCDYKNAPITIEFLNKSGEYYIERWYWINGNMSYEVSYKNGLKHGPKRSYYENGNISYETSYKNDKLHGLEKTYDRDGHLRYKILHQNGKMNKLYTHLKDTK